jgi:hypothetical protein
MASSLISSFDNSVEKNPLREAVRYTKKNMKWTANEFKAFFIFLNFNPEEISI